MISLELSTKDVYNHEDLKRKTKGEGAVVRKAIDPYLRSKNESGK